MNNDYLKEWINYLKVNKNFSEHTFNSYGRDVKEYLNRGCNVDPATGNSHIYWDNGRLFGS